MIRNWLISLLMPTDIPRGKLPEEQYEAALSKLYQNPGVMNYLEARHEYLIHQMANKIVKDELKEAKGLGGQLLEIEMMKRRLKLCYDKRTKEMKKRKTPKSAT